MPDYNAKLAASDLEDMAEQVMIRAGFATPDLCGALSMERADSVGLRAVVTAFQVVTGLVPDGVAGPRTLAALEEIRDPVPATPADGGDRTAPLPFLAPGARYPASRDDCLALWGTPGPRGSAWYRKHVVSCHDKGQRPPLPGVDPRRWVMVHRDAEPHLREALRRAAAACPRYFQTRGRGRGIRLGSHNYRRIRHDPDAPLSMHAWGLAVDVEPAENGARYFRRDQAPEPFTAAWWRLWPRGVPRGLVEAFASCGFRWGGDWDGDGRASDHRFVDPMHFEWCGSPVFRAAMLTS